ncbi:MAG: DUF3500 domain-containing protein [Bacteroidia bacterium]|nr:DUF3500 domain-containing protein [Bacteroidia bacterium]
MQKLSALLLGLFFPVVAVLMSCKPSGATQNSDSLTVEHATLHTMTHAAEDFLASLSEEQKTQTTFLFDDEEKYNVNFVPIERKGLPLRDMSEDQRKKAFVLLNTVVSDEGYRKANDIIQLEEVLRIIEGLEPGGPRRNTELYFICIFGTPSHDEPWAWRFEGHHLSLSFSSVTRQVVATPAFMATNPAIVRDGPKKGTEVLKKEQDLARALIKSMDETRQKKTIIAPEAPADIITGTKRKASLASFEGITWTEMTESQQNALWELINVFLDNMEKDIADTQRNKIAGAGKEKLYFAWMGGIEPGEAHYYRIHGPTLLIEYDNIQNNANHIHTTVRDLENDFGEDLLRRHYEQSPHPHE